jgi:hypothetical protein
MRYCAQAAGDGDRAALIAFAQSAGSANRALTTKALQIERYAPVARQLLVL